MQALTINEAARTTGWSSRMLRYVEGAGLVEPDRSSAGYRLYGPGELQRLRTLRELLHRFDLALSDIGFASRLRRDATLRAAVDEWLEAEPQRPAGVPADDWLRFEQDKHERLLACAREGIAAARLRREPAASDDLDAAEEAALTGTSSRRETT